MGTPEAPQAHVMCWQRRDSGALVLVDDFYVYADGRERIVQ